ncbi:hypothetical protein BHM03_00024899 [Ensete ventricosum]|nr:hypothetical protein BHM03_00024899 [Ensete ventricosum]
MAVSPGSGWPAYRYIPPVTEKLSNDGDDDRGSYKQQQQWRRKLHMIVTATEEATNDNSTATKATDCGVVGEGGVCQ